MSTSTPTRVERLKASIGDTPLRVQLVVVCLLLVALSLAIVGIAARSVMQDYLLDRVDNQLTATVRDQARQRDVGRILAGRPDVVGGPALQTAFFTMRVDANGDGVGDLRLPYGAHENPPAIPRVDAARAASLNGRPFTTEAQNGGPDWRVLVLQLADGSGSVIVGTSLSDVDRTVDRLTIIDATVSIVVLAVLGLLAYALVRSRLRRLVAVEHTAERIAAGDLSQRVPNAGGRSEVGRLAASLNTMPATIEAAFTAQRASEEEARRSEARMRRFVGDASHELRTPLTSIRGFAELFRQRVTAGDDPPVALVSRIESEGVRMSALVDDLLLLARLDQQRPIETTPVDMGELVADVVDDAAALGPNHVVSFEKGGNGPFLVMGDELRLRQVVGNLLMNAYTHTPGGTRVDVRLGTDHDQALSLIVSDDGPGMAAEDASRAFERFYRADPSRTRASGGSGLGLSIVASLVAAHRGTIELTSEIGHGTRFTIRLPLANVEAAGSAVDALGDQEHTEH